MGIKSGVAYEVTVTRHPSQRFVSADLEMTAARVKELYHCWPGAVRVSLVEMLGEHAMSLGIAHLRDLREAVHPAVFEAD